jgi:AcrR family transcriptional regulator
MYSLADRTGPDTVDTSFGGSTDGRSRRRERNRNSVIEALLALVREGNMDPGGAEIAHRAGVSHRSVFRYFDDLGDLIRTAIDTELARGRTVGDIPDLGEGTFEHRLEVVVATRLKLCDFTHGIVTLARVRAFSLPEINEHFAQIAMETREQLRKHFAPELAGFSRADQELILDTVHSLISWDVYDWHKRLFGHDNERIAQAWNAGLTALLIH